VSGAKFGQLKNKLHLSRPAQQSKLNKEKLITILFFYWKQFLLNIQMQIVGILVIRLSMTNSLLSMYDK
jgi:hypothetical protein